jgi:OOP family OmpA-OmpF porin
MKIMASGLMSRRKALAAAGALLLLPSDGSRAMAQAEPISVYFDWQKSDLGAPAKQIIAYGRGKITKTSRVTIAGRCDTSEASDKLALARALEVEKELVKGGIPGGAQLTIVSKGATDLRIQTGPNVREPQNRFVSITIE